MDRIFVLCQHLQAGARIAKLRFSRLVAIGHAADASGPSDNASSQSTSGTGGAYAERQTKVETRTGDVAADAQATASDAQAISGKDIETTQTQAVVSPSASSDQSGTGTEDPAIVSGDQSAATDAAS